MRPGSRSRPDSDGDIRGKSVAVAAETMRSLLRIEIQSRAPGVRMNGSMRTFSNARWGCWMRFSSSSAALAPIS